MPRYLINYFVKERKGSWGSRFGVSVFRPYFVLAALRRAMIINFPWRSFKQPAPRYHCTMNRELRPRVFFIKFTFGRPSHRGSRMMDGRPRPPQPGLVEAGHGLRIYKSYLFLADVISAITYSRPRVRNSKMIYWDISIVNRDVILD